MSTDVARLAMQIDVSGAQRARQALKGLQDGSIKAERATNTLIRSKGRLNQQSRATKNNLRGIALQLNQVAQQGALTGNFFQALAIQIPDLVVGMGPLGILLGGVAGGLAILAFSAKDAADATDTLRERVESLELSYRELTSAQKAALQLEFAAEERARQKQIKETEDRIKSLTQTMSEFRRGATVRRGPTDLAESLITPEQADRANDSLVRLQGELDTLKAESKSAGDELDELIHGFGDAQEAIDQANEKVKELNESLQFQVETYGRSERAIALAKIRQLEKNGADSEAVRIARQLTNALHDRKDAEDAASEAEERRRRIARSITVSVGDDPLLQRIEAEKRGQEILLQQQKDYASARASIDQSILASAASTAGNLANVVGDLAGRQSNAYRAAFLAQQGFAIASAVVSTQLAAAAALAPPPLGLGPVAGAAYAGTIQGLGAANVAIIAAQTIAGLAGTNVSDGGAPSFLGGGFTGTGSRTRGVDGRGGFPAILHPNETVIDHTKGQSMGGMSVSLQVIDQSTGNHDYQTEESTDQDGQRQLRVIIRDTVNNNIARGEHDRAMGSRFDLKSKGRRV